ncbi:MAG TPA: Rho termination factor N-terminal domain-containing protein [Acidobacteriota bacterium]|nr:Rho termination factor N-terminal domain-containing protein [Acidobacteriota bacterium]
MTTVINHGFRRAIPTPLGEVSLPKGRPTTINDKKVVEAIRGYPYIEIKEDKKKADFGSLKIWELRKIASKRGIKGTFKMKKSELVKKLEEQNER